MKKEYIIGLITGLIASGIVAFAANSISSSVVAYDNSASGLNANNVKDAVDALDASAASLNERVTALEKDKENGSKVQSHVGMIIESTTLDTEAKVKAIYGGTTWVKIEGKFLLGSSSAYPINSTGGEATHTLTIDEIPSHTHNYAETYDIGGWNVGGASGHEHWWNRTSATSAAGGGLAHNNMPPYKAVYIWERTA